MNWDNALKNAEHLAYAMNIMRYNALQYQDAVISNDFERMERYAGIMEELLNNNNEIWNQEIERYKGHLADYRNDDPSHPNYGAGAGTHYLPTDYNWFLPALPMPTITGISDDDPYSDSEARDGFRPAFRADPASLVAAMGDFNGALTCNKGLGLGGAPDTPLVLDLDGDGVETISFMRDIHFDHDGDGFAEKSGWVGIDDALLVRDINGNQHRQTGQYIREDSVAAEMDVWFLVDPPHSVAKDLLPVTDEVASLPDIKEEGVAAIISSYWAPRGQ